MQTGAFMHGLSDFLTVDAYDEDDPLLDLLIALRHSGVLDADTPAAA